MKDQKMMNLPQRMINTKTMKNPDKQSLQEIKQELDELEKRLNLGKQELKEAQKKHRRRFAALVKKVLNYVHELEHSTHEKFDDLKNNSKYLLDTLESDFNISYIDYNEKPQDLRHALEEFENSLKEYYKETGTEAKMKVNKLDKDLHAQIAKFKHEMEFYQVQYERAGKERIEDFNKWKQKRLKDVMQLKERIDVNLNSSKEKVGKYNEEISEAYKHLKTAFKN